MKKICCFLCLIMLTALCCSCKSSGTETISEDEIDRLLSERAYITKIIEYDSLPFDADETVTVDGYSYYKVNDANYDTWEKWIGYLNSIYTDEMALSVADNDKIIDIDGYTYTDGGGKGYDLSDDYSYEIVSEKDGEVLICLKNTSVDGTESYENNILFTLTDDGWRIGDA